MVDGMRSNEEKILQGAFALETESSEAENNPLGLEREERNVIDR